MTVEEFSSLKDRLEMESMRACPFGDDTEIQIQPGHSIGWPTGSIRCAPCNDVAGDGGQNLHHFLEPGTKLMLDGVGTVTCREGREDGVLLTPPSLLHAATAVVMSKATDAQDREEVQACVRQRVLERMMAGDLQELADDLFDDRSSLHEGDRSILRGCTTR